MTREAIRLTLIAAAPPVGGPAACFGYDGPGDEKVLARLRKRIRRQSDRVPVTCSPSRMASDTARALGYDHFTADEELRDRGYGAWGGLCLDDLADRNPTEMARWLRDPAFAPPGGESVTDTVGRATAWLARLETRGPIHAITHASLVRSFVVAALGCPSAVWFRLDIGHGTRTILTRHGHDWRVALVALA